MIIAVPKEQQRHEHRVGLTPTTVATLIGQGHSVVIERGAGEGSHFADLKYEQAGAQVVYNRDEIYGRGDLICRFGGLTVGELDLLRQGAVVCAFHHLAVAPRTKIERMMELEITVLGYEIVRDANDRLPVLYPMSEMAGQMAVHLAAHYLQTEIGGRGVLLGNVPGVPPPTVLVLGAGTVGRTAARQALDNGAHVIVVDASIERLRETNRELSGRPVTVVSTQEKLDRYVAFADVVIGAVLVPGSRTPFVVTEDMVRRMKPGSVIVDVSIDQGGCIETSRPTTLDNPTFVTHDVIHYCVPNMTANIARTASRALSNAALPYLSKISSLGPAEALKLDSGLADGVYLYRGRLVNTQVARLSGIERASLTEVLAGGDRK